MFAAAADDGQSLRAHGLEVEVEPSRLGDLDREEIGLLVGLQHGCESYNRAALTRSRIIRDSRKSQVRRDAVPDNPNKSQDEGRHVAPKPRRKREDVDFSDALRDRKLLINITVTPLQPADTAIAADENEGGILFACNEPLM